MVFATPKVKVKLLRRYKWSDDPAAQMAYKKVALIPTKHTQQVSKNLEKEKEISRKLREKTKKLANVTKRENDKWYQIQRHKKLTSIKKFEKLCGGFGYCIICGNLDLDILQEHHVFGRNYDEFTVTMCPNCHRRLHNFMGSTLGSTTKKSRKK